MSGVIGLGSDSKDRKKKEEEEAEKMAALRADPVAQAKLAADIEAKDAKFQAENPHINFLEPGEIFQGERISSDTSVHNYDMTRNPLGQLGENDNWQDLTVEEQDWVFKGILGRDPTPGEIAWQTNNGGDHKIKGFLHGAQNGELKIRSSQGEVAAEKMDEYIDSWAEQFDESAFDKIADFTGIKEFEDPYDTLFKTFGLDFVFNDLLDIKEVEEIWDIGAPIAAQIAATVYGGPAGAAAMAAVNAGIEGDFGDMAQAGAIAGITAGIDSGLGKAAFKTGVAMAQGDSFEDAAVKGAISYAGSYLGDNYGDFSSIVSNETLFAAVGEYYLTGDAKSAFIVAGAGAAAQKMQEIKTGRSKPDVSPSESFAEWVIEDAKHTKQEIADGTAFVKNAPSKAAGKIVEAIKGNSTTAQVEAVNEAFGRAGLDADEMMTDRLQEEVSVMAEAIR